MSIPEEKNIVLNIETATGKFDKVVFSKKAKKPNTRPIMIKMAPKIPNKNKGLWYAIIVISLVNTPTP